MPPEVVRPVASTTIGYIVTMVHRMSMTWVVLKPGEEVIRASGHGRSISVSRVRGLGLVLEYSSNGTSSDYESFYRIPSRDADKVSISGMPE